MRVLLTSLNYSPELTGIGKYNGEMCPWFAAAGDDVTVLTAPPYYPEWKVHSGFSRLRYSRSMDAGVEVIRCPIYVPRSPTTVKRLAHLVSFAISSGLALFNPFRKTPDVLVVVKPTFFTVPAALLYCRITKAKSILHIQDFEIDAMFGLGMGGKGGKLLSKVAFAVERWLLSRFDAVSTISYSMIDRAQSKGVAKDKLIFFPNWSDTDFVHPDVDGKSLRESWGIKETDKVVLYAGNIGVKQGLELMIEAASRYVSRPEVRFFIVGSGAHVDELKALAAEMNLTNIEFKSLQEWENVPAMLAMTDVHLVVQRKGVADVVLPSKLTNILSAGGQAVVTAESQTELGRLAAEYPGIYSCVEPENIDAFCAGIDAQLLKEGGNEIARHYAENHLNRDAILGRFRQDLHDLVGSEVSKSG